MLFFNFTLDSLSFLQAYIIIYNKNIIRQNKTRIKKVQSFKKTLLSYINKCIEEQISEKTIQIPSIINPYIVNIKIKYSIDKNIEI